MTRLLLLAMFCTPLMVSAHNFVIGQPISHVEIADAGEMLLHNDEIHYKAWNSTEFSGKVRIVQYIAGRRSAKKKNSLMIKAVKAADLPVERFQPTTIVNTDDEVFGTGFFVRGKIEKNKRNYPWAQFIIDDKGEGLKNWQLKPESSTILVLDKQGRVQWVKDGALTPSEVHVVIDLLKKLIKQS